MTHEPEKVDIAERVFAGMVKRCRDYRRTADQIKACERQRAATYDERGKLVLAEVIERLKKHLETFPPQPSKPAPEHWQEKTGDTDG